MIKIHSKKNDKNLNHNLILKFVIEGQSDKNTKVYDKMQEDHQCKSQCCVKSSENLEPFNCGVCCKSKNSKPHCCKKQCKTVDICSSNDCERPRTSDTLRGKLSCIIKRLDRLIDICPNQNESTNDRSATNHPVEIDTNHNNEHEKPPQETVIPVNNCETPVKSLSDTKVQPTQSKTPYTVDISSKQNKITAMDDKSFCEFQSTNSCTEVKDENQKEDCRPIDNLNIIKNNEKNKNICTEEAPTKPKLPPVPVKITKNTTNVITTNKPKPVQNMMCFDQIKIKQNSKNTQLSSSVQKNINKR